MKIFHAHVLEELVSKHAYNAYPFTVNVIPIKIPKAFSHNWENTLKFIWKHRRSQTAKAILNSKNKARGITRSCFKTSCRTVGTKTAWYDPKINTHTNGKE